MEKYKVVVNNIAEAEVVRELFLNLGYRKGMFSFQVFPKLVVTRKLSKEWISTGADIDYKIDAKELTIPELRDLVVLNRNDVSDATHEDMGFKYYVTSKGYLYQFHDGRWSLFPHAARSPTFTRINKSANMKEYLDPHDGYRLITANAALPHWIEVPEGADECIVQVKTHFFYKNDSMYFVNGEWVECNKYISSIKSRYEKASEFLKSSFNAERVWQRNAPTMPEELPFIDDEPYGHYKKDVRHLEIIDVYDVLKLFNVTDPCLQHLIKKALCAGQRGNKDRAEDLQDILDTAKRAVELNNW